MGNDEEDDYMGDLSRFLQPHDLLPAVDTSVQKPSFDTLGLSKQQKRKLKLTQQQKVEDQHRTEGLGSAISSSNKGFKMLQQMGYKPGVALGKHGQGSLEPINVDVKRSRSGLGRDDVEKAQEQLKARVAEFKRDLEKKKQAELKMGFQERRKRSWQGRKLISDYRKAQTALQHLEEAQTCTEHGGHDKENVSERSELKNSLDDNKEESIDNPKDDSEEEIELQVAIEDKACKEEVLLQYLGPFEWRTFKNCCRDCDPSIFIVCTAAVSMRQLKQCSQTVRA